MGENGVFGSVLAKDLQGSTEVVGVAKRRQFSDSFKRRVLDEVERSGRGEIGLILRREGLYSSQLTEWRNWRKGMSSKKNDSQGTSGLRAENQRLQKEVARLKLKLRKADAMLELQKKAAEILAYDDETEENNS
jgi:transposase